MRAKDVIAAFSGFRDPSVAAAALVFLHELSAQHTLGLPPRDARWQRILDSPEREWGDALDRACGACAQAWPEQLAGFFGEIQFADEPARAIRQGLGSAQRLASRAQIRGGRQRHHRRRGVACESAVHGR
jgi:hypothetical protein